MMSLARSLATAVFRRAETKRSIPIDRCYHYRGFRYGGFGNNPYEDYIVGLAHGQCIEDLRSEFARVVLECRPRTMGEALGIDIADQQPWNYPWLRRVKNPVAELADPAQNPDVICHHSEGGVLASHINREFGWLERSLSNIRQKGYRPDTYGYVKCIEFVRDGQSAYLVLDGNHRISALHAVGVREIVAECVSNATVRRSEASRWPQVVSGSYSMSDALCVFDRYFLTENPPLRILRPAKLIVDEPPQWAAFNS